MDIKGGMSANWYAIRSHPRKEESLWHQILNQGLDAYYPHLRVKTVNPRARKIRAYFPGYLFVKADLEVIGLSTLQWMPFAVGLVSFGGEPAIVPDTLIHAIRQRLEAIQEAGCEHLMDLERLHSGDQVRVLEGPFQGYEAIFDARIPGSERVRVLLKMLNQRNLPVEMDARTVKPVKKSSSQR
ncbi:MAG TPA: transcription termination/antitermination NusG family protein [Anaerolineaceae bacterium]|nr:transcription termination/antitermination NusG family protein [Anaerolineaceae bacterium]